MYEWFLTSFPCRTPSFLLNSIGDHILNIIRKQTVLIATFLLPTVTGNWHVLGDVRVNVFWQWEEHVCWSKHVEVLRFDAVEYVFVFCHDCEMEGQERDILQHLFSDHVLLCVCIC